MDWVDVDGLEWIGLADGILKPPNQSYFL